MHAGACKASANMHRRLALLNSNFISRLLGCHLKEQQTDLWNGQETLSFSSCALFIYTGQKVSNSRGPQSRLTAAAHAAETKYSLMPSLANESAFAAAEFYNSSAGSGDLSLYTGSPFGFHPRAMPGFALGFPAVFDNRLSQNDSQRMLTIVSNGNYLDEDTAYLTLRLLTFNAALQVYG